MFIHYGHESNINYNLEYPNLENMVLKILDFDLVIYHIYTPLQILITQDL